MTPEQERQDNEQVLDSILNSIYPPTNTAVLLRAARYACLEGRHEVMLKTVAWTLNVIRQHDERLTDEQRKAMFAVAEAFGMW